MSRKKLLIVLAVGVVIAASAAVYTLWPEQPDCGAEIAGYAENGEDVSDDCVEQLDRGVEKIEDQAAAISACHDAIEAEHAQAWTVPLTFDTTSIDDEPDRFAVTGDAHFTTGNGDRVDREYSCTVNLEGSEVLTVSLS